MKKWIVCLIAGLALLTFSTGAASDTAIRCDGELMLPGDTCQYTSRTGEVTSEESYDEVKKGTEAAHHTFVTWGRWAMLGGGLALTLLAIWGIAAHRRRAKKQGPTTADLYFQQQSAQAPPHPAQQPYPAPQQVQPQQQYSPQQYRPQQPFPPRPPQPRGNPVPPPAESNQDFGPGSGEDVTQRLR
ncbi:MAG TPA: hypothetical protein VGP26_14775 [Actinophytocola sp.]|jgi:hypothetical protein|nr:hypothetical protein [Actinophytocola sp.]